MLGFEVLTAVKVPIVDFWVVTPSGQYVTNVPLKLW
jgi:hypothetical protein